MKNLFIVAVIASFFGVACGGKGSYEMETFYSNSQNNGDTTMVGEKDNISADSDSTAFLKAQEKFTSRQNDKSDKGVPVKFTLRNHEGVIVTQPGQQQTREEEKRMYPNQKP
ncbi:MAG: hypothetical protein V4725_03090 [Bacteroidota bacterium]|nr:hypothetical protein [Ferruginibacter sp.]